MKDLSLFGISLEFRALNDLSQDYTVDEETGEVTDDTATLTELFNAIEMTLGAKLENTVYVTKELESKSKALKAEAKRLSAKAVAMDNKAKYLKVIMLSALKASGQEKLKTDKFSFTVKHSQSLNIVTEDNIGREFMRVKKEVDKVELKKALKEGLIIDGVSIVDNESIGVR
jgi:hypothetical protein